MNLQWLAFAFVRIATVNSLSFAITREVFFFATLKSRLLFLVNISSYRNFFSYARDFLPAPTTVELTSINHSLSNNSAETTMRKPISKEKIPKIEYLKHFSMSVTKFSVFHLKTHFHEPLFQRILWSSVKKCSSVKWMKIYDITWFAALHNITFPYIFLSCTHAYIVEIVSEFIDFLQSGKKYFGTSTYVATNHYPLKLHFFWWFNTVGLSFCPWCWKFPVGFKYCLRISSLNSYLRLLKKRIHLCFHFSPQS